MDQNIRPPSPWRSASFIVITHDLAECSPACRPYNFSIMVILGDWTKLGSIDGESISDVAWTTPVSSGNAHSSSWSLALANPAQPNNWGLPSLRIRPNISPILILRPLWQNVMKLIELEFCGGVAQSFQELQKALSTSNHKMIILMISSKEWRSPNQPSAG